MKKLNNKGFSLVELIIVIAIMAILVGVMAPQLMKYIEKSRYSSDTQLVDSAFTAIKTALAEEAAYSAATIPTTSTSISGLLSTSSTDAFSAEVKQIFGGDDTITWKSKEFQNTNTSATISTITYAIDANGVVTISVPTLSGTDYTLPQ